MGNENYKHYIEIAEVTTKDKAVSKNNYSKAIPVSVQKNSGSVNNNSKSNKE